MIKLKSRLTKHYFPILLLSIIIGLILHYIWPKKDLITLITDVTGYIAIVIITYSLIIGSINILLKRKNPTSSYFRRDIGITGGTLAVIHSILGLFVHLRGNMWQYFLIKTNDGHRIRLDDFGIANYTGLISCIIILLLLATSNDYFLTRLKSTNWKNIQRLSYLMFIFALLHVVFYRVVMNDTDIITYFYLPIVLVVFIFQIVGFLKRIKGKNTIKTKI